MKKTLGVDLLLSKIFPQGKENDKIKLFKCSSIKAIMLLCSLGLQETEMLSHPPCELLEKSFDIGYHKCNDCENICFLWHGIFYSFVVSYLLFSQEIRIILNL